MDNIKAKIEEFEKRIAELSDAHSKNIEAVNRLSQHNQKIVAEHTFLSGKISALKDVLLEGHPE
jgi:uncharacterized membrane protein (DUF106 family)